MHSPFELVSLDLCIHSGVQEDRFRQYIQHAKLGNTKMNKKKHTRAFQQCLETIPNGFNNNDINLASSIYGSSFLIAQKWFVVETEQSNLIGPDISVSFR